jgi:uncharacterized membrane protein
MKTKQLVLNAIIAAIYTVITLIFPSFTALQFRLSEVFAHLPVFNRKYSIGLILGVAIANIWSPFGIYDVLFGTLHTVVSLVLLFTLTKKEDSVVKKMIINTVIFSATSFIIALMIYILDAGVAFWGLYASIAASIAVVMAIGIPVMKLLDDRIHFNKQIEN